MHCPSVPVRAVALPIFQWGSQHCRFTVQRMLVSNQLNFAMETLPSLTSNIVSYVRYCVIYVLRKNVVGNKIYGLLELIDKRRWAHIKMYYVHDVDSYWTQQQITLKAWIWHVFDSTIFFYFCDKLFTFYVQQHVAIE